MMNIVVSNLPFAVIVTAVKSIDICILKCVGDWLIPSSSGYLLHSQGNHDLPIIVDAKHVLGGMRVLDLHMNGLRSTPVHEWLSTIRYKFWIGYPFPVLSSMLPLPTTYWEWAPLGLEKSHTSCRVSPHCAQANVPDHWLAKQCWKQGVSIGFWATSWAWKHLMICRSKNVSKYLGTKL